MVQRTSATFRNGVLLPDETLSLKDGERVELIVQHSDTNNGTADRDAAFQAFVKGTEAMNVRLTGPLPTRDELHER